MPRQQIRLSEGIDQDIRARSAQCAPATVKADEVVTRRFLAAVGDLYVENLRPEHVERFFTSLAPLMGQPVP